MQRRLGQVEKDIGRYFEQIVESENRSVIAAYERKISDLERSKLRLEDLVSRYAAPKVKFEEAFELSMEILRSRCNIWKNGDHDARISVLRFLSLYFSILKAAFGPSKLQLLTDGIR